MPAQPETKNWRESVTKARDRARRNVASDAAGEARLREDFLALKKRALPLFEGVIREYGPDLKDFPRVMDRPPDSFGIEFDPDFALIFRLYPGYRGSDVHFEVQRKYHTGRDFREDLVDGTSIDMTEDELKRLILDFIKLFETHK
jgi:hypothetical protein